MGKVPRFRRPDTTVLTLPDGETLTVRRRLTAGQQREGYGRTFAAGPDGRLRGNPLLLPVALVTSYLLDWTITDADGRLIDIRGISAEELTDVLNDIEPWAFNEIKEAIEAHEAKMIAERLAEKNAQDGEKNEPATSPSPFAAAGASSGSVN
jgi:hypothetical protein